MTRDRHRMNKKQAQALGLRRTRPHKKGGNHGKGEDALVEIRKVYLYIQKNPGTRVRHMRTGGVIRGGQKYWKSRWPAIRDYLLAEELIFTRKKSKRNHFYYPTDPEYLWPVEQPIESDDVDCPHGPEHPVVWNDDQVYEPDTYKKKGDARLAHPTPEHLDMPKIEPTEPQFDGPNETITKDVGAPRISMSGQFTDCIEVRIHDANGNIIQEGLFGSLADVAIENIKAATVRCELVRTSGGRVVARMEIHLP